MPVGRDLGHFASLFRFVVSLARLHVLFARCPPPRCWPTPPSRSASICMGPYVTTTSSAHPPSILVALFTTPNEMSTWQKTPNAACSATRVCGVSTGYPRCHPRQPGYQPVQVLPHLCRPLDPQMQPNLAAILAPLMRATPLHKAPTQATALSC